MKKYFKFRSATLVRLAFFVAVTVITMGCATLTMRIDRSLKRRAVVNFEQSSAALSERITERMDNYSDVLYAGRAFVANSTEVTPAEWHHFFTEQDTFNRYKGLSTILYLDYFGNAQRPAFVQKMQARTQAPGGPGYTITPEGIRDTYAVVSLISTQNELHLSPDAANDLYTRQPQRQAMDLSRLTNQPQATEPYILGTDIPGFSVALPVYKNNQLSGYTFVSFRTADLMQHLLGSGVDEVRTKIIDVTGTPKQLYSSPRWNENLPLKRTTTMTVAGRSWEVTFGAENTLGNSYLWPAAPLLVLTVGLLLLLVLMLVYRTIGRRFAI